MTTDAQSAFEAYDKQSFAHKLQEKKRSWDAIRTAERDCWAHAVAVLRREGKIDARAATSKERQASIVRLTAERNAAKARSESRGRGEAAQRQEKDRLAGEVSTLTDALRAAKANLATELAAKSALQAELAQFSEPIETTPEATGS